MSVLQKYQKLKKKIGKQCINMEKKGLTFEGKDAVYFFWAEKKGA